MKKTITALIISVICVSCSPVQRNTNDAKREIQTEIVIEVIDGFRSTLKRYEFSDLTAPTNLTWSSSNDWLKISYNFSLVEHTQEQDSWEIVVDEGKDIGASELNVELDKENHAYHWSGKTAKFQIRQIRTSNQRVDLTR